VENVVPLEEQDPFLADEIRQIANGMHPVIKSLDMSTGAYVRKPVITAPKVRRNDKCPCGSGKKYKKCCM